MLGQEPLPFSTRGQQRLHRGHLRRDELRVGRLGGRRLSRELRGKVYRQNLTVISRKILPKPLDLNYWDAHRQRGHTRRTGITWENNSGILEFRKMEHVCVGLLF